VYIIAVFVALVFDTALSEALSIDSGGWDIRPTAMPAVAVFVALSAPRLTALWACMVLGLLVDLNNSISLEGGTDNIHLVGPFALGYVFSGYFICQLRASVFRRRALTIAVLTVAFAFMAAVVAVSCGVIRSWLPLGMVGARVLWPSMPAGGEMLRQFFSALYSGLLAWPLGWLLGRSASLWGFQSPARTRSWR
jgi:cell shape-determining protein MreD